MTNLNTGKAMWRTGLEKRIQALAGLGEYMRDAVSDPAFRAVEERAVARNPVFTPANVERAVRTWGEALRKEKLEDWLRPYFQEGNTLRTGARNLALVMAGNIPIVGFHDYLCGLLCGFGLQIKLSSKDPFLPPFLHGKLLSLDRDGEERKTLSSRKEGERTYFPATENFPPVVFTEGTVSGFDAIIATGSGNTFRYFTYYFGRYPHLLRKNRTSCAVLDGKESPDELRLLADDALSYFGMGCRNVSKLYVPENYDFQALLEAFSPVSGPLLFHPVYKDNYDYHKAVFLVNRDPHFDNGSVLLAPSTSLASPMGGLYYENYRDKAALEALLEARKEEIQCIVGKNGLDFGQAQSPGLSDYADGIDILDFLLHLP